MTEINKMREQFEDQVLKAFEDAGGCEPSLRFDGGAYSDAMIQSAWWGWKSSREAVVVELPKIFADESVSSVHSKCARAIESQGLKVAP